MGRINYVTIRGSKLSFGYPQNELCENLNADMVDNYHASQTAKPYTIPVAGADGKIDPEYLPAGIGGGDIKVVIDYVDYHKYVKQNEFIYITPQAHTDQEGASIDYYKWILPNGDVTTTPNSNPTLVYEDTSELGTLTFRVTAVDTYGNQSASKTINIEIVEELPPVINSISWNMTDFYENKSYIMTVNAESYENKPLSYQVTCGDPSVTIENYQDQQNKFLITFPELTEEKLYDLNVVVSDGDLQDEKVEQCVAKPMLDFVYRFENVYACSNIVADNQGYLYVAMIVSSNRIMIEKMDKGLITITRKTFSFPDDSLRTDQTNTLLLQVLNSKLYVVFCIGTDAYTRCCVLELNLETLQLERISNRFIVCTDRYLIPTSITGVNNTLYIHTHDSNTPTYRRRLFSFDTQQMKPLLNRKTNGDPYYIHRGNSILYDPTQDRLIEAFSYTYLHTGTPPTYLCIGYLDKNTLQRSTSNSVIRIGHSKYWVQYQLEITATIINDKLFVAHTDFDCLVKMSRFDLSKFPDIQCIEDNIAILGQEQQLQSNAITSLALRPINNNELLCILTGKKDTRGGYGVFLTRMTTGFEVIGTAKIDSVYDDKSLSACKNILCIDNFVYIPFYTKGITDNTICLAKINIDNITNENQSFNLQSLPIYMDTGVFEPSYQDFSGWTQTAYNDGVYQVTEENEVNIQEISYTPETYRDPFI